MKEAHDYDNIPEDIIQILIKTRQTSMKEQRQVKRTEKMKNRI